MTFLDKYGLIKTKVNQDSTGNACLYTVLYRILCGGIGGNTQVTQLYQRDLGVLWRTPENTYGQNSHDEYTALGVWLIIIEDRITARQVLWSAIQKCGFMQNDFREENAFWKSQMFRFPQIWLIMIAAAFPSLQILARLSLTALASTTGLNIANASGTQLTWLLNYAILLMGNDKPMKKFLTKLRDQGTSMSEVMSGYFETNPRHPILDGYDEFTARMI